MQILLKISNANKIVLTFRISLKMVAIKNANARQNLLYSLLGAACWGESTDSKAFLRQIQQFLLQRQKNRALHLICQIGDFQQFSMSFFMHPFLIQKSLFASEELHNFITNRWKSQWDRFYLWPFRVWYDFSTKRRFLKWTNYLDVDITFCSICYANF